MLKFGIYDSLNITWPRGVAVMVKYTPLPQSVHCSVGLLTSFVSHPALNMGSIDIAPVFKLSIKDFKPRLPKLSYS